VKERKVNSMSAHHRERGFSLLELMIVVVIMIIIATIAIVQIQPAVASARADSATREVVDQMRQAREYAITNRRYVQITFPVVVVGGQTQYQVQMTVKNSLTAGAGADVALEPVPIQPPITFYVNPALPDTPDLFGNGNKIFFGGIAGGPPAGMMFQSDGELVAAATYLPINGTVFLGIAGQPQLTRAVTVLGTTGRVRGWKYPSGTWTQF
jgi:prepilin-type N-terminal cleavage/methylation domain-containing protein